MIGKIRSPRNYSDGKRSFEVDLYTDDEIFPIIYNERTNYTLTIGDIQYIGGVRSTEQAGSWISPDIYKFNNPSEKIRLSEVLIKNGFTNNEIVLILYNSDKKELVIKKK